VTEGETGMTVTCMTSSATKMPVTRSKVDAKNETMPNKTDMTRGAMIIMAPSTTNIIDSAPLKEGAMKESKPFPTT
jgi:hypothetical protein